MKKTVCLILLLGMATGMCGALVATTTSISSSPNPSLYGQSVTFTATVTSSQGPPPDGEAVNFVEGTTQLGTGTLTGGVATFTTSTLTVGTDKIKAEYPGDSTFAASTSQALPQVVQADPTTTTLTSSPNPSGSGQTVVFTATVTGEVNGIPITGTVAFYNGATKIGAHALSGGVATFSTSRLPVGTNQITAVYLGSKDYASSTSNVVSQVVGSAQVIDSTMTWNGITRYYEVYIPATVTANPAMLLMLHGTQSGSSPHAVISLNWGWQSYADTYGFILVKPASTYDSNSNQWNWDAYFMDSAFPTPPDDSGFLRQLIVNLTAQYNVNPNQVFVAGFSSGAQMAHRVGIDISDLVAAVAIASGTIEGQTTPPPPLETLPNALAPVSIQESHGTADTVIPPCNYGTTRYNGVKFYVATVDDSFNYWTAQNACTNFANNLPLCLNDAPNPNTTGNDATSCTNGAEVQFIWKEGVSHVWVNSDNATRWQFLSAHPKPQ